MSRVLCVLICFIALAGQAQEADSSMWKFRQAELTLKQLQKKTFYSKNEAERIEGNKAFMAAWSAIITDPRILDYPFDSLKDISVLSPADHKFKLITWNLFKNDGTHYYFGFLLVNNTKKIKTGFMKYRVEQTYDHYVLVDRSAAVKSPENYVGTPDKWFGMLYTQLVECDGYYTLIGWDGNDKLIQRKFIDVLYFKSNGDPVFGKDVFRIPRKNPRRVMFEWSQEVTMSVKYNKDRDMIIFNHLVPRERGGILENQFQFYGPDAQFDALQMRKDRWELVEDVEANSDIAPAKASKKPNPRKQKTMYSPKNR